MQMISLQNQAVLPHGNLNQLSENTNFVAEENQGSFLRELEMDESISASLIRKQSEKSLNSRKLPINFKLEKQCITCQKWSEWALISEKKMLEIESQLIKKQITLDKVIKNLKEKIINQNQRIIQKQTQMESLKARYEYQISMIQKDNSKLTFEKQKLIQQISKYSNLQNEKNLSDPIVSRKTIKIDSKQTYQNFETLKILKNNNYPEYGRKSHTQQTITDCSFLNQFQNIDNEPSSRFTSYNRNPEAMPKIDSASINIQDQIQKEIKKLKFENQNLKSYNKVLIQKLSNSKAKKY